MVEADEQEPKQIAAREEQTEEREKIDKVKHFINVL